MLESSPGSLHCGTQAPGWLQGSHPQGINETKDATACFHFSSDRYCQWSKDIAVTNCGDFYV